MNTPTIVQKAVSKLEHLILNSSTDRLPPIKNLAKEFGVSSSVMMEAARVLRNRGVLDFSRGRGLHIVHEQSNFLKECPCTDGYSKTVEWIKKMIRTGDLRTGIELPKYSTIAGNLHVSCTTVHKAVRYLITTGAVHRSGKRVLAGPPQITNQYNGHLAGNTILVLHDRAETWNSLAASTRTSPFISSFVSEVNKYNVHLQAVFVDSSRAREGDFPSGLQAIYEFAQSLGNRYCGTLLLPRLEQFPEMAHWVSVLNKLRRPVVWFDRLDQTAPPECKSKMFFRSYFSEEAAAKCAVDFMKRLGYTSMYFVSTTKHDWCKNRADLVCRFGNEANLDVTTVMEETLEKVNDKSAARACAELLKENTFLPIVSDRDKTTILLMAHLKANGLKLKKDYGIISFDNYPPVMPLGITSVDFGFDWLGYAAFHTIFGVIPIEHQRTGDILPRPYIVDRGSMPPLYVKSAVSLLTMNTAPG